jgi:hypothetical protein
MNTLSNVPFTQPLSNLFTSENTKYKNSATNTTVQMTNS